MILNALARLSPLALGVVSLACSPTRVRRTVVPPSRASTHRPEVALPEGSPPNGYAVTAVCIADPKTCLGTDDLDATVRKGKPTAYAAQKDGLTAWMLLGTLSTLSNGGFLIFTAPMWMIGGSLALGGESRAPERKNPPLSWVELATFARCGETPLAGSSVDPNHGGLLLEIGAGKEPDSGGALYRQHHRRLDGDVPSGRCEDEIITDLGEPH